MMKKTGAEGFRRLHGLYAITPETEDLATLAAQVRAALEGGARLVQYRAKRLPSQIRLRQAQALLALCREAGVPLIVNDDLELAQAIDADGLHLGGDDADLREARSRIPVALLGISCYDDPSRAIAAAEAGADYVAMGSVFPSSTKPEAVRCSLDALSQARRLSGIPVAAIGGITPENAALAVGAGADMIAVISSLFGAPDICAAARALSHPFDTEADRHVRTKQAAL